MKSKKSRNIVRSRFVDINNRKLLISVLEGSKQAKDITLPVNCDGLGRIRHFKRYHGDDWPEDPLPIDPACFRFGLNNRNIIKAQVFQIAVCDWRCWYCFVPRNLIEGNERNSRWVSVRELLDLYLSIEDRPFLIDLSGGNPELVPEWVYWMIDELEKQNLSDSVYLWSDDSLSNDNFWRFLSPDQIERIQGFRNYGRVCCFKGFDPQAFEFNTNADRDLYEQQFTLFRRLLQLGLDMYAYVTLTYPDGLDYKNKVKKFIDDLQMIHEYLPLRTVPLKIEPFTPVINRMTQAHYKALKNQYFAAQVWSSEMVKRFNSELLTRNVTEIQMGLR